MNKNDIKIIDTLPVYVAYVNSDCTEGRGFNYPLVVSENKSTVERLGEKKNVQGSNAQISERVAVKINGEWYAPCRIISPTKEDSEREKNRIARQRVLEKAKSAGLTEDEINLLSERKQ